MTQCKTNRCCQGQKPCPTPTACKGDAGLPVMHVDTPLEWAKDVIYTAIFISGSVILAVLILAFLMLATGLHRVLF